MRVHHADSRDKALWDGFVSRHPCGHFMQSYAWGELRKAQGWAVTRLMVLEGEAPLAAMMVQSKAIPLTGRSIAYSPRGPVFDAGRPDALRLLLEAAWTGEKPAVLRLDPYCTAGDERCRMLQEASCAAMNAEWSHWNNPRYVMWLDISQGIDSVYGKISSKMRNEIRKPEKIGVTFRKGRAADLAAFCALMRGTAEHKDIPMHDNGYYLALYEKLTAANMLGLFLAEHEDKAVACGMSVKYGDRAWLLYAASSKEHFRLRANRALQMRMIEWAVDQGCSLYDMRGSATLYPPGKSDRGYGVYEFKKSFGAELVVLAPYFNYVPGPAARVFPALFDRLAVPLLYAAARTAGKCGLKGKTP